MATALEKQMQKLKDMGVTISVRSSHGGEPSGVSAVVKQEAQKAGIYYGGDGVASALSPAERAEVDRFGIHDEDRAVG